MWINNEIFREDLEQLISLDFIEWDKFRGKTIFITGATGVIGFNIISALLYADMKKFLNLKILAFVRDIDKAMKKYDEHLNVIAK